MELVRIRISFRVLFQFSYHLRSILKVLGGVKNLFLFLSFKDVSFFRCFLSCLFCFFLLKFFLLFKPFLLILANFEAFWTDFGRFLLRLPLGLLNFFFYFLRHKNNYVLIPSEIL